MRIDTSSWNNEEERRIQGEVQKKKISKAKDFAAIQIEKGKTRTFADRALKQEKSENMVSRLK